MVPRISVAPGAIAARYAELADYASDRLLGPDCAFHYRRDPL